MLKNYFWEACRTIWDAIDQTHVGSMQRNDLLAVLSFWPPFFTFGILSTVYNPLQKVLILMFTIHINNLIFPISYPFLNYIPIPLAHSVFAMHPSFFIFPRNTSNTKNSQCSQLQEHYFPLHSLLMIFKIKF